MSRVISAKQALVRCLRLCRTRTLQTDGDDDDAKRPNCTAVVPDVSTVAQIVEPSAPSQATSLNRAAEVPDPPVVANSGASKVSANPGSSSADAIVRRASVANAADTNGAPDRNFAPGSFSGGLAGASGGGGGGRVGSGDTSPKGNTDSSISFGSSGSSGENDVQSPSSDSNRNWPDEGLDTSGGNDTSGDVVNDDTSGKYNEFPQQGPTNPPAEVPEPGTLGLLRAGLLSCAAARRKR